jgi:CubicO group peptidase (beta-lactamase class C family)
MKTFHGHRLAAALAAMSLFVGCSSERVGGEGSSTTDAPPDEGDSSAGSSTTQARKDEAVPATAAVEDWLSALVPWGFRGAVAVVDHGVPLVLSGFGETGSTGEGAIGVDTRFAVGSNTKPITALAILVLEDRGLVDADSDIAKLLPGVPNDKAQITVRQLLTHSAGLESHHGVDSEQLTKPEALRRIFQSELLFAPGSDNSYSNSGYTLLAAIVEEVSGVAFDDFLRTELFGPAGMDHSGFLGEPVPADQQEAVGGGVDGPAGGPSSLPPVGWALRGAGGVVSSLSDQLALDEAIASGLLLSEEAKTRWEQPLFEGPDGRGEGYGWVIAEPEPGVRIRSSAGGNDEIHHVNVWTHFPGTGRTLIILSADGRISADQLGRPIRRLLDGEAVAAAPPVRPPTHTEIAAAVGTYRSAEGASISVEAHPDVIRAVTADGNAFDDLFPLPSDNPGTAGPDQVVDYIEGFDGPVYREWLDQQTEQLGPLVELLAVGVAPVEAPEPATFVRHVFERGSVLTRWAFTPNGEPMSIELRAEPPGVTFRPAPGGGFVSFTLTGAPLADRVTFGDAVMMIQVDGRSVEYRREG